MRKIILIFLVSVIVLVVAFFLLNFKHKQQVQTKQIVVATTIPPLSDIAWQIAGADSGLIIMTILPPGASPHTFEPTPQDIRDLQDARIIFSIGHGLDDWISKLTNNLPNAKNITVDSNIELKEHGEEKTGHNEHESGDGWDPHYWLAIKNAKQIAKNIEQALIEIDPQNKSIYNKNLETYLIELDKTDQIIKNKISTMGQKNILTYHDAWNYFGKEYGINIIGTFELNPGQEPTAEQLADLQQKIIAYKLKTIFVEPQLSEQTVKPFTQDLGLKTAVLDPMGNQESNMGYTELMLYNADTIVNSMK